MTEYAERTGLPDVLNSNSINSEAYKVAENFIVNCQIICSNFYISLYKNMNLGCYIYEGLFVYKTSWML